MTLSVTPYGAAPPIQGGIHSWPATIVYSRLVSRSGSVACPILWVMALVLGWQTRAASPGVRPIQLEFAWSVDRARRILDDWNTNLVQQSVASLGWDYGFILAYGAASATTLWLVYRSAPLSRRQRQLILMIPVTAAFCDYVENCALVIALATVPNPSSATLAVAGIAASTKFLLLGLSLVLLIGALAWRLGPLRQRSPTG